MAQTFKCNDLNRKNHDNKIVLHMSMNFDLYGRLG